MIEREILKGVAHVAYIYVRLLMLPHCCTYLLLLLRRTCLLLDLVFNGLLGEYIRLSLIFGLPRRTHRTRRETWLCPFFAFTGSNGILSLVLRQ